MRRTERVCGAHSVASKSRKSCFTCRLRQSAVTPEAFEWRACALTKSADDRSYTILFYGRYQQIYYFVLNKLKFNLW